MFIAYFMTRFCSVHSLFNDKALHSVDSLFNDEVLHCVHSLFNDEVLHCVDLFAVRAADQHIVSNVQTVYRQAVPCQ